MKADQILKILKISRPSLAKYVREGLIKATLLPTKRFNYDEDSVYQFLLGGVKRKIVIYSRVSTSKQKQDLENQVSLLKQFCFSRGLQVHEVFSDIASGISFENRSSFFELLDQILEHKIDTIVISYKDRLSRVGFGLFQTLFAKFGTKILVMSEVGDPKLDSQEIFEEIVSLLHCYSMKLYSKRRRPKIEEITKEVSLDENQ